MSHAFDPRRSALAIYVGRITQFDRTDWFVYLAWVGLMLGLVFSTSWFVQVGRSHGVVWPAEAYFVPAGAAIFAVSIAIDTIGHRTVYKEVLRGGEQLVHQITILCGVASCVFLMAAYNHHVLWIPAMVFTVLSFLYSLIDEVFHWRRYIMQKADPVEMWSHVGIFIGHVTMMLGWWRCFQLGYPGVRQTLAALALAGCGSVAEARPAAPALVVDADAVCQYPTTTVFDQWEDAQLGGRDAEASKIAARLEPLFGTCVDANKKGAAAEQPGPLLWLATVDAERLAIDPMANLSKLAPLTKSLERVAKLAPGAHDAAAEVLLGTLAAGRAQFVGGDDGAAYFTRARKLAGEGALMIDVMYARGVAVARKDRALFQSTLQSVIDADLTRWPERRAANELAQKKAKRYLAAINKLIPASAR